MEDPGAEKLISSSQGVHIVLDRSFLPGGSAMMVPETDDGRIMMAVPWQGFVVVGTTDTPADSIEIEPRPFNYEIEFILRHAARYLTKDPVKKDILSIFTGLRPLVSLNGSKDTKVISREHVLVVSDNGLVTITSGKWTTCRKMAEDTVKRAARIAGLPPARSITKDLKIHGYHEDPEVFGKFGLYGSDAPGLRRLTDSCPEYKQPLHQKLSIQAGEVVWAVRNEMAQTVEDFLARRRRPLFQDVRSAVEAAPKTAALMAKELKKDKTWEQQQIAEFKKTARNYLLPGM
jgi:glycerol-3-phosphate dehydrogenase